MQWQAEEHGKTDRIYAVLYRCGNGSGNSDHREFDRDRHSGSVPAVWIPYVLQIGGELAGEQVFRFFYEKLFHNVSEK